jgi:hypothetical protein
MSISKGVSSYHNAHSFVFLKYISNKEAYAPKPKHHSQQKFHIPESEKLI